MKFLISIGLLAAFWNVSNAHFAFWFPANNPRPQVLGLPDLPEIHLPPFPQLPQMPPFPEFPQLPPLPQLPQVTWSNPDYPYFEYITMRPFPYNPSTISPNTNTKPSSTNKPVSQPNTTKPAPKRNAAKQEECMQSCPFSMEEDPVCGTDGVTYKNPRLLLCYQSCGVDIQVEKFDACSPTTPPAIFTDIEPFKEHLNKKYESQTTTEPDPTYDFDSKSLKQHIV